MAKKEQAQETAYSDVSKELEEAEKAAEKGVEFDEQGNPKDVDSGPARTVAEEQAIRASGAANGGGPFPPELLIERGTTPLRGRR